MHTVIVLSLLLVAQQGKAAVVDNSVRNAKPLVTDEWWHWKEQGYRNRIRIVSLRPGEQWREGKAWAINRYIDPQTGGRYEAFQGRFRFSTDRLKEDVLLLKIGFVRKYDAKWADDQLEWKIDLDYAKNPIGVEFEIPLHDRRVPDDDVRFVVARAFCVDGEGAELAGVGALASGRQISPSDLVTSIGVGETFRLTRRDLRRDPRTQQAADRLTEDPPPGFELRKTVPTEVELGVAAYEKDNFDAAIDHFTKAIADDPSNGFAYSWRGHMYSIKNDQVRRLRDHREAVRLDPDRPHYLRSLAWDLAVVTSDTLRDGKLAVEHATKACELTAWKDPFYLDTLAAACAESGDYGRAVEWQKQALQRPEDLPKGQMPVMRERLRLYEQKRPFRED